MPRKVDTAYVEFLPDFSAVVRGQRDIERQLAGIESVADDVTSDVEDAFADMQREVEESFDEMARDAGLELDAMARSASDAAGEITDDFQRSGERAEDAFDELRRAANADLDAIERKAQTTAAQTSGRFKAAGIAIGAAFAGIGLAATAGLGAIATMGLMSAAQLEQTQISFNALLGSAEKGEEVFKSLQQFAATTPFEFPEIADAGKRFLAFNESVGMSDDQLESFLTTIGDLAAVTGTGAEGLNRIVYALGQIGSKGKTSLEELLQISEAVPGFSAIAAVADALGVTSAEAMELISAGAVDAVTGVNAILAGMEKFPGAAGAMELQAQTLLGVFSTFKDTVGQALAGAFEPVIPAIKDALTELTPVLGEALGVIAPALGGIISAALPLIGDLVTAIVPVLTPILDGIAAAFEQLGPVLTPIGEAIGGILEAFAPLLPVIGQIIGEVGAALAPVFVELGKALIPLAKPIADIVIALLPLIQPLAQLLVIAAKMITPFAELLGLIVSFISVEALGPAIEGLVFLLELVLDPLEGIADAFNNLDWGAIGSAIGGAFSDAWGNVVEFFEGIAQWFRDLPGLIGDAIAALPRVFVAGIKMAFKAAFVAVGIGIGSIIAVFKTIPRQLDFIFTELPGILVGHIVELGLAVHGAITGFIDDVIEDLQTLPQRAVEALAALGSRVGQLFTDAWDNAERISDDAIDAIVGFVQGIPRQLAGFATSVASGIVDFFKRALNSAIDGINSGIAFIDDRLIGVSLPRLPRLAHGGVAFGPAIIGEDPSTAPEVALPLNDSRAMSAMVQAFTQALAGNGGSGGAGGGIGNIAVYVSMDGQQFQARIERVVDEKNRQVVNTVRSRR